jgi:predicted ATP-binding protein involved in virulence
LHSFTFKEKSSLMPYDTGSDNNFNEGNEMSSAPKLEKLRVKGLFGRFDYEIKFKGDENLTIITAPNGYGKTVLLTLINDFFSRRFSGILNTQFDELSFDFSDGKEVKICTNQFDLLQDPKREPIAIPKNFGPDAGISELKNLQDVSSAKISNIIDRYIPLRRISQNEWYDDEDDELYNLEKVLEVYSDSIPSSYLEGVTQLPAWLLEATSYVTVHLIETQRLLNRTSRKRRPYRNSSRAKIIPNMVESHADHLRERIGDLLRKYADEAQKLDQSFPKRIVSVTQADVHDEVEIKELLNRLNNKRDLLVEAGLLGKSIVETISPNDRISEVEIRRILGIYIDDTNKKLSVFDDLFDKIQSFKDIVDRHFTFKGIKIGSEFGFNFYDIDTGQDVPLRSLSSGEQHELVLLYELLFKVQDNALILIDEPELSLHVDWQMRFLDNLSVIKKLRNLQVVVATHSPHIINNRWELVTELSDQVK